MKSKLTVASLFKSLQGEGIHQGLPCTFLRLAGCNLSCSYCDTDWARRGGSEIAVAAILESIRTEQCQLINLTGGEPLLQEACLELMDSLIEEEREVLLETNGSISLEPVPRGVRIIMDIKCPDSQMADTLDKENLKRLRKGDEVKFVLSSREDYEFAKDFISRESLKEDVFVLLSPVWQELSPATLAEWMLEDNLDRARLNLQLHKVIWKDDEREH